MHFHLPKPLHGWREFTGEVGIIVIGVLIALGAEQVVEDLRWRHTIANERKALDADVLDMWTAESARVVIQRCVDSRLGELALVFARHQRGEPLGIIGPIGRPSVWTGSQSALEMATADGSLSHMPLDDKAAYFAVAEAYDAFAPAASEERASWRTLELLDEPESLDEMDWRDLRRGYRDAVDTNRTLKSNLAFDRPDQWLTAFARFGPLPENKEAMAIPWVADLCRPAVKR
jgi:hypothetical protein